MCIRDSPTPQQLVNLDKSIAYLRIGYIGFEQAWMAKMTTNAPHLKIFDTSKGIDVIQETGHNHGDPHYEEMCIRDSYSVATNLPSRREVYSTLSFSSDWEACCFHSYFILYLCSIWE